MKSVPMAEGGRVKAYEDTTRNQDAFKSPRSDWVCQDARRRKMGKSVSFGAMESKNVIYRIWASNITANWHEKESSSSGWLMQMSQVDEPSGHLTDKSRCHSKAPNKDACAPVFGLKNEVSWESSPLGDFGKQAQKTHYMSSQTDSTFRDDYVVATELLRMATRDIAPLKLLAQRQTKCLI
uniref:Uncharacterized protein n=1 Tax=Panagrellus redivivus TaxID=6233 RepID=A0A7E4W6C5_PANRE